MKNYIKEIHELCQKHVKIRIPENVNRIIDNFIIGGYDKLQVVSDFDKTITKQHGKSHLSSFALFAKCPSVTKEHLENETHLTNKYLPIEKDPNIPYEEKRKYMVEWWSLSEKSLKGLRVSPQEIREVCASLCPPIRDNTKDFFNELNKVNVPVLVFSAGLGDTVQGSLMACDVLLPNVEIISNFLDYSEDGRILGFKNKIIHIFNKNEYAIKGTPFYNKVLNRDNVILLGDSIGDANMVEGIDHIKNVLKIGFLYDRVEESLPIYMETFDIVLVDDQTMNVPLAILNVLKDLQTSSPN